MKSTRKISGGAKKFWLGGRVINKTIKFFFLNTYMIKKIKKIKHVLYIYISLCIIVECKI